MTPETFAAAMGEAVAEPAGAVIDVATALMLVIIVCLVFMARELARLSRRIDALTGAADARPVSGGSPARGAPKAGTVPPAAGPSPETIAAITAAVFVACEQPVHIVAVNEISAEEGRHWSMEGRRQIFTSHQVR